MGCIVLFGLSENDYVVYTLQNIGDCNTDAHNNSGDLVYILP